MVFFAFLKLAEWIFFHLLPNAFHRVATNLRNFFFLLTQSLTKSPHQPPLFPSMTTFTSDGRPRGSQTLVFDVDGALLRSQSFFPFFMLVAFEGGSIFRALLLLLSFPILWVLDYELKLRAMVFVTFCGLRERDMEMVGRAVLPKFYLENMNLEVYEAVVSAGSRVVVTSVPRVMVEGFLKEYLNVEEVVGTELNTVGRRFTGLVSGSGLVPKATALKELFGGKNPDIGIGNSSISNHHLFLQLCKEPYVVNSGDIKGCTFTIMPRERYPKPLVFHDGRLAFLPTASATLFMFIWLPLGISLAIFRLFVGIFLPYKMIPLLLALSGLNLRVNGQCCNTSSSQNQKGVLYVCNHRTLMDTAFLSTSLGKPLTTVTYSLSKISEFVSPNKTVRLIRDKKGDGEIMERLLSEGDMVVCPEGTTCREPYLLRFSSLFANLTNEIIPVAMNTHVTMFYGTTANGFKSLDSIFFMMNPRPTYYVHILEKVPKEFTCAGDKSNFEVANYIQRQLGAALGFECTNLTRSDKYMMLVGNRGMVQVKRTKRLN